MRGEACPPGVGCRLGRGLCQCQVDWVAAACEHLPKCRMRLRCRELPGQPGAGVPGQLCTPLPRNHPVCGQVSEWSVVLFVTPLFSRCIGVCERGESLSGAGPGPNPRRGLWEGLEPGSLGP